MRHAVFADGLVEQPAAVAPSGERRHPLRDTPSLLTSESASEVECLVERPAAARGDRGVNAATLDRVALRVAQLEVPHEFTQQLDVPGSHGGVLLV